MDQLMKRRNLVVLAVKDDVQALGRRTNDLTKRILRGVQLDGKNVSSFGNKTFFHTLSSETVFPERCNFNGDREYE
jgi:hypothetical protein